MTPFQYVCALIAGQWSVAMCIGILIGKFLL